MKSCLFCDIAAGSIPADVLYQDERAVAFRDIHPQAPVHLLVVPREHIENLAEAGEEQGALLGHLLGVAARLARQLGIAGPGFRTVINTNREAGQTVYHLHVHVLGGRPMGWPPG